MNGALILIVEDNEANQLLARAVLEMAGYRVDVAGAAPDALKRLSARTPDLILMDLKLPGQDGLSFMRQLKANPKTEGIPIVALTADDMQGDRSGCLSDSWEGTNA